MDSQWGVRLCFSCSSPVNCCSPPPRSHPSFALITLVSLILFSLALRASRYCACSRKRFGFGKLVFIEIERQQEFMMYNRASKQKPRAVNRLCFKRREYTNGSTKCSAVASTHTAVMAFVGAWTEQRCASDHLGDSIILTRHDDRLSLSLDKYRTLVVLAFSLHFTHIINFTDTHTLVIDCFLILKKVIVPLQTPSP